MLRVGLFSYAFPLGNRRGYNPGIESFAYHLAKHLAREAEVTVYTASHDGTYREGSSEGFRFLTAPSVQTGLFSLNQFTLCRNLWGRYREEIEKENVLHDLGSLMPFWFPRFSSPTATTFHHHERAKGIRAVLASLPTPLFTRKEGRTDRVVAVSEFSRGQLLGLEVPPEAIEVIPNGVDHDLFRPDGERLSLEGRALFFCGPLTPRKGVATLVEALPRIQEEIREARVFIAGEGSERNRLAKLSRKLGVAEDVHLLGFLSQGELAQYHRSAEVFVFPTRLEGFGMSALEAMASGTPVVASDIEPVRSLVDGGGLFFPPGSVPELAEAVIRLFTDARLREDLRKEGIRRASEFSWEETARRYLALYHRLLEERQ
jgi:glycosyltransferase involved in cell wall biosynthesis